MRQNREGGAEVMIATHNQESVEHAVGLMHKLDMNPKESGVFFGQLMGMSDPLTFVLGKNGYKVGALLSTHAWCRADASQPVGGSRGFNGEGCSRTHVCLLLATPVTNAARYLWSSPHLAQASRTWFLARG